MKTIIVNFYKDDYDVYIGRSGKGQDGYFGNPYGDSSREENINRFKEYFYWRLENDPEYKKRILELKGKRLACFCKPKACHGDVIADYLDNLPEI